ncbi:MAG: PQQ-binding-like beta-propeller repeat protein [Planctomycetota bacterium]
MRFTSRTRLAFLFSFFSVLLFHAKAVADWPVHRGNPQRTAFRIQPLTATTFHPAWINRDLDPPSPAWPAPARGSLWQRLDSLEPRVDDDRGDVPLIVSDSDGRQLVLIASSSSDRVIAIDALTGRRCWQYLTDAPIRFAPAVHDGMAWFGADDGIIRAIDLRTGDLLWSQRIGPEMPMIVGNGRLIHPHPIRTGVVWEGDTVYVCAGLFPSQGVYMAAFDARSGELRWRRRTMRSTQGYLLADAKRRLYVPCGRANPFAISMDWGSYLMECPSSGGSFCMVTQDAFFTGPGNDQSVESYRDVPDSKPLPISGRALAVGNGMLWTADGDRVACFDLQKHLNRKDALLWEISSTARQALIVSGNTNELLVFVADDDRLEIFNALTGRKVDTLSIPDSADQLQYLAVSASETGDLIVASSRSGQIYAWKGRSNSSQSDEWPVQNEVAQRPETNRNGTQAELVSESLQQLESNTGFALVLNDFDGTAAEQILRTSRMSVVSLVGDFETRDALRERFASRRINGRRVTVLHLNDGDPLPFADRLFNLAIEVSPRSYGADRLDRVVESGTGVVVTSGQIQGIPAIKSAGFWRHLYASPGNTSDSRDSAVGAASGFRLQWFGGVGPARMPDRHLRGHAPLAAGSSLIMHGEDSLIGVDPANGTERWQLKLPNGTTRLVMPYDSGYSCLTQDGATLITATPKELWRINTLSGKKVASIPLPLHADGLRWGYVSESHGKIFGTCMKQTAARLKHTVDESGELSSVEIDRPTLRQQYSAEGYESAQPLVCSRQIYRIHPANGQSVWDYISEGVIPNGSVAIDEQASRMVFIEGLSDSCKRHPSDRITVEEIRELAVIVCLDTESGKPVWRVPLPFNKATNVLYTQIADGYLLLSTSESTKTGAVYHLGVHRLDDGEMLWKQQHRHLKDELGHGEQVQHPLLLRVESGDRYIFAEPYFYNLASGEREYPAGLTEDWALSRPGHSCGTVTGAGNCLFFRAGNPTVMNLNKRSEDRFTKLSPSRPGCWINMIPSAGRLLIPEGSASCVCAFPLQTSMGFVPLPDGVSLPLLEDFPSLDEEPLEELYSWRFDDKQTVDDNVVPPIMGDVSLTAGYPIEFDQDGMRLNGRQWLFADAEDSRLPRMPLTVSLEAHVRLADGNTEWSGIVGATEDNGDYERGCLLGINEGYFFFSLASESKAKLTYLKSPVAAELGRFYHLVGTYDGSLMRLFVNGKLAAVTTAQSGPLLTDQKSQLIVGAYKDKDEHYPLRGFLKRAAIFRGALSSAEVKERASALQE